MSEDLAPDRDDSTPLHCPKCKAMMEKVTFQNIMVDRCTACRGLWFDALEREQLLRIRGSEAIDLAMAPDASTVTPRRAKFDCPVCHTPMIDMVDQKNWDLQYELCEACAGVFFDAGEFRECKEHRIFGSFREWMDRSA
jgi:Zn-finger nucleic acid-binding protein